MSLIVDQSWVADWVNPEVPVELLRRHYSTVQHLMTVVDVQTLIEFPPLCLVSSRGRTDTPYPGTLAIVVGYTRNDLLVRQSPYAETVQVRRNDVQLAHYWHGQGSIRIHQQHHQMPTALGGDDRKNTWKR